MKALIVDMVFWYLRTYSVVLNQTQTYVRSSECAYDTLGVKSVVLNK